MSQTQVFQGTARKITQWHGAKEFWYHNTAVVSVTIDTITLDSGGWLTATTKLAMNQASNQYGLGFTVYQRQGSWFVSFRGAENIPFVDGMKLHRGQL